MSNIQINKVQSLASEDETTLINLISDIWEYRSWNEPKAVKPMVKNFLTQILMYDPEIFVIRDKQKIIGAVMGSRHTDCLTKSRIRLDYLESLVQLISMAEDSPTTFVHYLETLKLNEQLLQKNNRLYDASLDLLLVDSNYQGLGLGHQLYDHFLDYLNEKKLKTFYLFTDSSSNFSFYEKKGVRLVDQLNYHWTSGDTSEEIEDYYLFEGTVANR